MNEHRDKINDTEAEQPEQNQAVSQRRPGGLYSRVKVSVKTVNIIIIVGVIALFASMAFLVTHNGFTVSFDTDGGSKVESCKVMYGETVIQPDDPVKEGWVFTGWYSDSACKNRWNIKTDTVTDSMTLYAGWKPASSADASVPSGASDKLITSALSDAVATEQ